MQRKILPLVSQTYKEVFLLSCQKGESGADMDMEMDCVAVVIGGMPVDGGSTDAIHLLRKLVTRWDIAFHHNAATRRSCINQENVVFVVDCLEDL